MLLFVGAAVVIADLAERLRGIAVQAGLPSVGVEVIGLRPGEKQREELTVQGLELLGTSHPSICVARQAPFDASVIRGVLADLRACLRRHDAAGALAAVGQAVPEYEPSRAAVRCAAGASDAPALLPMAVDAAAAAPACAKHPGKTCDRPTASCTPAATTTFATVSPLRG